MASYTDLVGLVRDWSNRDPEALPDSVIQAALRYAADTAYRELEIPPLEHTTQYIVRGSGQGSINTGGINNVLVGMTNNDNDNNGLSRGTSRAVLPVPGDLVTFMHIRIAGRATFTDNGDGTRTPDSTNGVLDLQPATQYSTGVVFNEKTDTRTFYDLGANTYNYNLWSRQGSNLILEGFLSDGDVIELFYYRRLPALNAVYDVSGITDATDSRLELVSPQPDPLPDMAPAQQTIIDNMLYQGAEIPNWLRDENEKVVLFGALHHIFDYLGEVQSAQQYLNKFLQAVEELNREERMRKGSGGNVQVHFNSTII